MTDTFLLATHEYSIGSGFSKEEFDDLLKEYIETEKSRNPKWEITNHEIEYLGEQDDIEFYYLNLYGYVLEVQ